MSARWSGPSVPGLLIEAGCEVLPGGRLSALAELTARIRTALDQIRKARGALSEADQSLNDARHGLAVVLAGSDATEAEQAVGLLAQASSSLADVHRMAAGAESHVQGYLTHLGVGATTARLAPAIGNTDRPPVAPTSVHATEPASFPPARERIEQLRAELPPTVDRGKGQKTHGRWIDADGNAQALASGKDEAYENAIQVFKEMKSRHIPQRASDTEMKLAAHMRKNGIRSAVLVINHVPCAGPLGCDALIPVILPEGYTLTVYGANGFVREYQGGEKSSWVP
jgi:nucleic acid/nucleotide deaminase of polymorphic system toxin